MVQFRSAVRLLAQHDAPWFTYEVMRGATRAQNERDGENSGYGHLGKM